MTAELIPGRRRGLDQLNSDPTIRRQLHQRLLTDLVRLSARAEFVWHASYHSTGFGRITLFSDPIAVVAPGEMTRIKSLGRHSGEVRSG